MQIQVLRCLQKLRSELYECMIFIDHKKANDMVDKKIINCSWITSENKNQTLDFLKRLLKLNRVIMAGELSMRSIRGVFQELWRGPVLYSIFRDAVLTNGLRDIKELNIVKNLLAYVDDISNSLEK